MGSGAETDVWGVGPVGGVVAGFVTGSGEVGNLIVVVTGRSQNRTKFGILFLTDLIRCF